ncbi:MAG: right-handed parallel beta-helix repeat-containing protein, partial [Abitibacteriaceae bacterium]|nr:right-handed parallel beta-helix repeat-containing protein [Abditibacteriaceae bacterium]
PILLLTGCSAVAARTVYVSTSGDDTSVGTVEKPLHTVGKALKSASAGDTITIGAGTYREAPILMTHSGSATQPITIQGAPRAEVVLKGSQVVTSWQDAGQGLWRVADWKINSQQLFCDGKPLQQIGVQNPWHTKKLWADKVCLPPVGKDVKDVVPGSFFYDGTQKLLFCMLPDKSDPNQHLMEASVQPCVMDGGDQSYVTLRHLSLMHCNGTAEGGTSGVLKVAGSGWRIEDCTLSYSDFAGISMAGDNHIVRDCKIINNGDSGIGLNGSDAAHNFRRYRERPPQNIVFEDLTVTGNNYRHFYDQWHAGGMKIIPAVRGITIRRCNVSDNEGAGIWFDGDLGSNVIEDNLVANNYTGIFYEISEPSEGDPFCAIIRNNRVVGSRNQGIYISASRGVRVQNNTCYKNRWDIVLHGMQRKDYGYDMQLRDNVITDNILYGRITDLVMFLGPNSANNMADGNFYADVKDDNSEPSVSKGVGFSATTSDYSVTHQDLGKLFQEHGFEQHGQSGDPLWVNPAALDFRLRPGSPAQGKGWQENSRK